MILARRGFLRGLLIAAPAIVAAPSLMRVSTLWVPEPRVDFSSFSDVVIAELREQSQQMIGDKEAALWNHIVSRHERRSV